MPQWIHANIEKEMETYGYDAVVKSHCRMCHGGCGVLVYTKGGRVGKIAGDPDTAPSIMAPSAARGLHAPNWPITRTD